VKGRQSLVERHGRAVGDAAAEKASGEAQKALTAFLADVRLSVELLAERVALIVAGGVLALVIVLTVLGS
jgi:hypothetical protein